MQVSAIDHDPAALDLVAHFLGIATHDNVNAAPAHGAAPKVHSDMAPLGKAPANVHYLEGNPERR